MTKKKKANPLITIVLIVLVVLIAFSGYMVLSEVFNKNQQGAVPSASKTVTIDGVEYFPRQDITVIMLLGIDERGPVTKSESYNNTGECDMVALAVFDEVDKTYSVLTLNRDTMMDIPVIGIGGKQAGTIFGQLALSHTYGTGLEDSCENTKLAVSQFLSGLAIDYYVSMNMDAIAILNDAVGGVTVNVQDDFSQVDGSIPMGEVTLNGEQALSYVHTRKDVGNQMNISRMDRHKEYMGGFVTALGDKMREDDMFVLDIYDEVAPYIVSDCSVNSLNSMLNRYIDYELKEIVSPQGENILTEQYMEFHVDQASLDKLLIDIFYTKKNA